MIQLVLALVLHLPLYGYFMLYTQTHSIMYNSPPHLLLHCDTANMQVMQAHLCSTNTQETTIWRSLAARKYTYRSSRILLCVTLDSSEYCCLTSIYS
jgi:hypothetical protein